MAKILQASCNAGVVTVHGLTIPGVVILSEGKGPSEGIVILDDGDLTYISNTTPDLKTTLTNAINAFTGLSSVLTTISTTLTAIGAGMTGPTTAPPPTLAAQVAIITAKAAELTASRVALETLKGSLQ